MSGLLRVIFPMMREESRIRPWFLAVVCALFMVSASAQQDDEESAPPTQDEEQQQDEGEMDDGVDDSLDELLGLEEDESGRSARDAAERDAQEELETALSQQKAIDDAFREALEKMSLSADLLGEEFDPGLGTQRVQEEILEKLDLLIQSARNQQGQQSSSSSSSSQQQSQQQQVRRQQQNQQQQGQNSAQRTPNPADSSLTDAPTEQMDAEINLILAEADVEWGALPARTRDQLMQAMRDKPSMLYRKLTHEYFKRISDESSR
jgi:hypothetical protein